MLFGNFLFAFACLTQLLYLGHSNNEIHLNLHDITDRLSKAKDRMNALRARNAGRHMLDDAYASKSYELTHPSFAQTVQKKYLQDVLDLHTQEVEQHDEDFVKIVSSLARKSAIRKSHA